MKVVTDLLCAVNLSPILRKRLTAGSRKESGSSIGGIQQDHHEIISGNYAPEMHGILSLLIMSIIVNHGILSLLIMIPMIISCSWYIIGIILVHLKSKGYEQIRSH